MKDIQLKLPWPVSTNGYYGHIRGGRKYVTHKGKAFAKAVHEAVLAQLGVHQPLKGRLSMEVQLYPPDRRKRDIDNHAGKSLLDSLTAARVWDDDSQVDRMVIERKEVVSGGFALVRIFEH